MPLNPFIDEAWTEYALGMCVFFIRIFCRVRTVGMKWAGDDYIAVVAIFFWTAELCMLQLIGENGSITGMNDEIALQLTEEEKKNIVFGSKCLLAAWCIYVTMIWLLKACMLFLYGRLTLDLKQRKMVKTTAIVCAAAYVATMIVVLSHCIPMSHKWQIYPYPGDACALNTPNYYTLVVTNVLTDIMITLIPLPLLWQVQMPLQKKLLCGLWLCTGIFIMMATLLRCILCLQDVNSINTSTIWSIREPFIGIVAVNTPVIGPWIARNARHLPTVRPGAGSKESNKVSGASGNTPNHIRLSILEKKAKEQRIRRGLGWATIDEGSNERIVQGPESQPANGSHSSLSGNTTNGDSVSHV